MRFHAGRLAAAAAAGHALATEVAELLVRRGVPFRQAHEAVGHMVVWCQVNDCELGEVSDEDLQKVSPHLTPDVRSVLSVAGAIAARDQTGGTAPERVAEQLGALRHAVAADAAWAAA
jgi:argininosuccinate lyase